MADLWWALALTAAIAALLRAGRADDRRGDDR